MKMYAPHLYLVFPRHIGGNLLCQKKHIENAQTYPLRQRTGYLVNSISGQPKEEEEDERDELNAADSDDQQQNPHFLAGTYISFKNTLPRPTGGYSSGEKKKEEGKKKGEKMRRKGKREETKN